MKKILLFAFLLISVIGYSQPGCPDINAGTDQTLTCSSNCTNLTSTYLATGQSTTYTVSNIPYTPPYPFNTGTAILVNIDDTWSSVINLPFDFCFFGTNYNSCIAGSNGVIDFNTSYAGSFCDWSFTVSCPDPNIVAGATGPYIMGPYHDIDPSVTGTMYYALQGTYPCRTLVFNWNEVAMFSCNSLLSTHQIVLYESTNVIEVYVHNAPLCSSWNSGNSVIGIQNAAGNVGFSPTGYNTGAWSATDVAFRFTPSGTPNYTVSWWQGATQIGTGATVNVCPTSTTTYTAQIDYDVCGTGANVIVTDDVVINVNNSIGLNITPSNPTTCPNQAVNLTATCTDPTATYQWSSGGTGASTTVNPTTTTTYTVTATTVSCTTQAQVTVTMNTITVDAGVDQSGCPNIPYTLTASGATTYQWSTGGSGTSISVTPTTTTTYTVTGTSNGCTASDIVTINIANNLTVDAGTNQIICQGQSANLTASGANTYLWSNGSSTQSINVSPTITTTYTVTGTSNGCTGSDIIIVTVNPPPPVSAGLDQTICQGQANAILTASGASNYLWSSGETTMSITVSPTTTTTYTVIGTDVNGCTNTDVVIITVLPSIIVDAGLNQSICVGSQVNLSATGANSYVWSSGQSGQTISVSPTISTTYTVTGTSNGCTNTDNITITVNTLPTITTIPNLSICYGETTTISVSGGVNYIWSNGMSGSSINVNPVVTNTYQVTGTDANGCTGIDNITVTVNQLPPVNSGQDQTICFGFSATITASGAQNYVWNTGQNTSTINVSPTTTTTYTVTGTDVNGCTNTDEMIVTVNQNPIANAGIDQSICQSNSTTITASGGGSYQWSYGQTTQTITVSPNVTTTYSVTVTLNGCTATDDVVITVNKNPIITGIDVIDELCDQANGSVTVNYTDGTPPISFEWSNSASTQTITNLSAGIYYVTVVDANGCYDDMSVAVNNTPGPTANFTADPDFIWQGDPVYFTNLSSNYVSSDWILGDGNTSTEDSPIHQYDNDGTFYITLTVTDANGCTDYVIDSLIIVKKYVYWIPNTFTPNGNTVNEIFFVYGMNINNEFNMKIFDRWGNMIFESNDQNIGWDGKVNNNYCPQDVYVYKVTFKNTNGYREEIVGRVTLLY
jgi:gliding motility-associated-like protein